MAGTGTEQVVDIALLPGQLKTIATHCGDACMWAVWRHYGGGHCSVPYKVDTDHPLVLAIGWDNAQLMVRHFAPRTLQIAKAHGAQLAIRNGVRDLAIYDERFKQRKGLFEIAKKWDLSERQVINVLNKFKQPCPNFDLFE